MAIDPETVTLMATYRVGFLPPADGSLSAGEIHIELAPMPRLWLGGLDNTVVLMIAAPPVMAPINRAVPHVMQQTDTLTCTMGIWTGEPHTYAYAWQLDGAPVGTDAPTYTVTPADVGMTAVCVVTATNDAGTTEAPPSNSVVVA